MRVTAIIAAGGSGSRLGGEVPKQFLELGGRTILERAVAAFTAHPRVDAVIVALPSGMTDALGSTHTKLRCVPGGSTRQTSVANAFDAAPPDTEIVLVHDAARPFVSGEIISQAIDAAAQHGAAIVASAVTDTVKQVTMEAGARVIAATIPRESIFLAQTPQAFRRDVLARVLELGAQGAEGTDEAALAEQAGCTVLLVPGDPRNIKITTQADLAFARGLLLEPAERTSR